MYHYVCCDQWPYILRRSMMAPFFHDRGNSLVVISTEDGIHNHILFFGIVGNRILDSVNFPWVKGSFPAMKYHF